MGLRAPSLGDFVPKGSGGLQYASAVAFIPQQVTAQITVDHLPPTVTPPATESANQNVSTAIHLGSFNAAGPDGPWTVDIHWNDGSADTTFSLSGASGSYSLGSLNHTFTTKGVYTVTETVTDADGGVGSATFQVIAGTLVTNTNDSGPGSLRRAITYANAGVGGTNTITFAIPNNGTSTETITLTSALPTITAPVVIDGTSEAGYSGTPLIVLNGGSVTATINGLNITAGNSTVTGSTLSDSRTPASISWCRRECYPGQLPWHQRRGHSRGSQWRCWHHGHHRIQHNRW